MGRIARLPFIVNPPLTARGQARRGRPNNKRVEDAPLDHCPCRGVVVGAVALIGFRLPLAASAAAPAAVDASAETFVLQATGDLPACLISKPLDGAPVAKVQVEPECDRILPGCPMRTAGRRAADGTVVLAANDGLPIVTFEIGDGVAYESIEPRRPLMTLIERN